MSALFGLMGMRAAAKGMATNQVTSILNFVGDLDRKQMNELTAEVAGIRAATKPPLGTTIRIPVIPIFGFAKNFVRVANSSGRCTGTFVGPKYVLTNLHCVGPNLRVERDFVVEKVIYGVSRWWTAFGNNALPPANFQSYIDDDWAILEIEGSRLDGDQYMFVDSGRPRQDREVMIAGYSDDISSGAYLTMDIGCQPTSTSGPALSRCSTYKGSSGAAVVPMDDPRVLLGLNNAGDRRVNSTATRGGARAVRPEKFLPKLRELMGSLPTEAPKAVPLELSLANARATIKAPRPSLKDLPSWNE